MWIRTRCTRDSRDSLHMVITMAAQVHNKSATQGPGTLYHVMNVQQSERMKHASVRITGPSYECNPFPPHLFSAKFSATKIKGPRSLSAPLLQDHIEFLSDRKGAAALGPMKDPTASSVHLRMPRLEWHASNLL